MVTARRRIRRPARSFGVGSTITVNFAVSAEITSGNVTPEQFEDWIRTAIGNYHSWRVGWVGLGMHCSLKTPKVVRIEVDDGEEAD